MRHSEFREWAKAALGDTRQVYARATDTPSDDPLVFMPDGAALRFREAAQSGALICPVPGCSSPRLTTRGSDTRRDHFMHVHAPADAEHDRKYRRLATRRLLLDWATGQARVVDMREAKMDGVSIALVAGLDDGNEVALCYVDTKLGADAWEERDTFLRSKGLAVAWIFALRKMYFAPPDTAEPVIDDPDRTDLILDQAIYRRMRKNGSWPLLINLERQKFGNVFKPNGGPAKRLGFVPPVSNRVQHIAVSELGACRLCRYGIATPAIKEYTLEATKDTGNVAATGGAEPGVVRVGKAKDTDAGTRALNPAT